MTNLAIPGVGSLVARRFLTGAIQAGVSLVGIVLMGYFILELVAVMKDYSASVDEPDAMMSAMKGLWPKIKQPMVVGGVGLLIYKAMWIWAMVTTVRVFKAEKAAEAAAASQPGLAPVDSSN